MPSSYVVRRRDAYHFRLRVPAELAHIIGSRELHSSLGHATRKAATLRASFLAFHAHAFFGKVRTLMESLTPQQIAALVTDWRQRMFTRDGEIRRLIELDLHDSHDSDSYADHCEAVGELAHEALASLVSTHGGQEGSRRPSTRERRDALDRARQLMATSEPDSDHVALMDVATFDALDDVSARDVARQFLLAMGEVYSRKATMCADSFVTARRSATERDSAPTKGRATPAAHAPNGEPHGGPTIEQAWSAYGAWQARTRSAWTKGPPDEARRAWEDFAEVIGRQTPVAALTVGDVRRYEKFADEQPQRRTVRYRNMSAAELVAAVNEGRIPVEDRRTGRTVGKHTSAILAFLNYCRTEFAASIPDGFEFRATGKTTPSDESGRYEAWTAEEIGRIFDPATLATEVLTRRENATRRVTKDTAYPDGRQFPDFPWMLLLALYTGARRNEILGLTVDDVARDHAESRVHSPSAAVPVIYIRENEERGLKTKDSTRCVPIHPDLIELGIFELAERRRAEGSRRLLYSAPDMGKAGTWLTDVFTKYRATVGIPNGASKVFHSFRHWFRTQASGVMDTAHAEALLGHAVQDSTGGTYLHATQVPQHNRASAMKAMRFPVDVQGLKAMLSDLGHPSHEK